MVFKASAAVLILLSLFCGCRPSGVAEQDARDRQYPLMVRARQQEQSGNLDRAAELYQQVVDEIPRAAEAHLSLALLLHDAGQDYLEAVCHYRAYLRKRPATEKADLLRERIRKAEQLLAVRLARTLPKDVLSGGGQGLEEIRDLKERLAEADGEKKALSAQNQDLKNRLAASEREIERLRRRVELLIAPSDRTRESREAMPARQLISEDGESTVRTYEVKPGDNLSRIAQLYYGDAALWRRIRDANRDKVDGQDHVQPGQVLVIPPVQE